LKRSRIFSKLLAIELWLPCGLDGLAMTTTEAFADIVLTTCSINEADSLEFLNP